MNSIEQEEWVFARTVADSDAVLRVYAAPEFDEMSDDGKEWIRALVVEARRTAQAELVSALDNLLDIYTRWRRQFRSEEHTSELQSIMRIAYAVLCLNKK